MQQRISNLFINKATKKMVHVNLESIEGSSVVTVRNTVDGITLGSPVIEDMVIKTLPRTSGNLYSDALVVFEHFRKNGYKSINTFGISKKGPRLS
jgi:hypothetical protein